MDWLNRNEVKTIVEDSLRDVANWDGDCEDFRIELIPQVQMIEFLQGIQSRMNEQGLHISLSHGSDPVSGIQNYVQIRDLIDYIYDNQAEL